MFLASTILKVYKVVWNRATSIFFIFQYIIDGRVQHGFGWVSQSSFFLNWFFFVYSLKICWNVCKISWKAHWLISLPYSWLIRLTVSSGEALARRTSTVLLQMPSLQNMLSLHKRKKYRSHEYAWLNNNRAFAIVKN